MKATSAVRKIPLNQLVLSPTNVRKTPPSAAEDAELKASIKARGLKQNLVVHRSADEGDVSRRHRRRPAAEGACRSLPPRASSPPITRCRASSRQPDEALETSLMENTIRAAMHPADEFVAMAALIDAGATDRGGRRPLRRSASSGSSSACASASSRPSCSTPIATAPSASKSSWRSPSAPITRRSSRCGIRSRTSTTSSAYTCGVC